MEMGGCWREASQLTFQNLVFELKGTLFSAFVLSC
jgi:hypothetical protein